MNLNRNTDIIKQNGECFANVNTQNSLIKKMVSSVAENIYSFNLVCGSSVDKQTAKEMQGTYWTRVGTLNEEEYDDVEVVTL